MRHKPRALIVEHDAPWKRELERILKDEDFLVHMATNSSRAIAQLKKNTYDLVTINIGLPEEAEIAWERIASTVSEQYPSTKILIVTGDPILQTALNAINSYIVFGYFNKNDFDLPTFRKKVRSCSINQVYNSAQKLEKESTKPNPFQGNDLESTLDSFIKWKQYLANISRYTVILFADLVGSTKIKESEGIIEGLVITRQHNQVISDIIMRNNGTVVKYIGDCVMARYDYDDEKTVDCRSINTAIEIQEALSRHTQNSPRSKPIETRIGIASGKVADFYINDPQGECVDLAARLQSRAQPGQILVSEELLDRINISEISSEIGVVRKSDPKDYLSGPHKMKLKGFSTFRKVFKIVWEGSSLS